MKLKTRLLITFLTIVILPLFLAGVAIVGITCYVNMNAKEAYGLDKVNISLLLDPVHGFTELTNEEFDYLKGAREKKISFFENKNELAALNEKLFKKSSFLLIRREKDIFYSGNENLGNEVFLSLAKYGMQYNGEQNGYFLDNMERVVRQVDFRFTDGSEGSAFIITKVTTFITGKLIRNVLIMIVIILVFTSFTLTRWMQSGVFVPIRDLNNAMKNIAEGNLDYSLPVPHVSKRNQGEIYHLYANYEQMRLKLKDTTDEKIQTDTHNRELLSNISHDLKTPITSIKGYVEGIMDGVADTPEKMDKYIKTIYNKTNDLDRLINELTIYTNIDANRIPYHFHKLNVAEYFNDCIEEVGLDLDSKNIKLNYTNLVSPDTLIIADPEQLKRVIDNIIGNSVKYIDKPRGVIDIRILDEVDSIRVEIEDNGKGVSAKELGRIFERFYRTDASRNSAQGGSGIGLSIVKKIIEDHGGYIWATSREDEGMCMHFVIRKYEVIEKEPEVEQV